MARSLANACAIGDRKVTFFMRKGADVLSKWVGESEKQLRMLFEVCAASQKLGPAVSRKMPVGASTWGLQLASGVHSMI